MVPGRVLGPEGGEGGEGLRESGRGWVCVWGGAGHSKGSQSSAISAVGGDGGEAGFTGQNRGGGGVEVVCSPSLDSVPEAVHASEGCVIRGEEVGTVSEYGAKQPGGNAVAQKGFHACSRGGEAFDEGEDSLG